LLILGPFLALAGAIAVFMHQSVSFMVLDVQSPADPRLATGIELLSRGGGFRINAVEFISVNGTLSCSAVSQWQPENLTDDCALAELRRAQETHETLLAQSDAYSRAVAGMSVRYSVIENYAKGTVELCHLDGENLVRAVA
jgi:hypothetical protein